MLSFPECSAKLAAATGLALQFVEVTPQASTQQLTGAGVPQWLAEGVVELYETLSTDLTDDIAHVTGRPPISFDQFVQDYARAFKG